jgi:DNA replication and repair protein RecF
MRLKNLHISCFRNLGDVALIPGARFNIIHGNNAQGKTNLLESIYLLGTMKSFRHARNGDLVMWGETTAVINGLVEKDGVTRNVAVIVDQGGKRARVDRKTVTHLADFFGSLNVVVFSPEEMTMMKGLPETRRRYLDRAIFSGDENYLVLHHEYTKILRHRNILLKTGDNGSLAVWSEKLARAGAAVIGKRLAFIEELLPLLDPFHRDIAGSAECAGIAYHAHRLSEKELLRNCEETLLAGLAKSAGEERRYGTTLIGPHRDDVTFMLNGKPVKQYGSQGEQRSFVLALKMAEIEYLQKKFVSAPVLLLDDISSELDRKRNGNLMEFLKHKNMQVFISTTSLSTIALDGIDNYSTFPLSGGKLLQ